MGENDENKPNEQGQLPSYEQSIQIPEDDKPELPPAYRFVAKNNSSRDRRDVDILAFLDFESPLLRRLLTEHEG